MIVVSDTSPICYLVLIDAIDLLPQIYGEVVVPEAVYEELNSTKAPVKVREWLQSTPSWFAVRQLSDRPDSNLNRLDKGEQEAIVMAEFLRADIVLIDEKAARKAARERNLNVVGTLGVLRDAANVGLIELESAINRLTRTNIWLDARLIESLLEDYRKNS